MDANPFGLDPHGTGYKWRPASAASSLPKLKQSSTSKPRQVANPSVSERERERVSSLVVGSTMDHNRGQYGHGTTGRVDEYGNPVGGYGTGTGGMGMGTGTGAGTGGQFQPAREEHKTGGILHRSGSSSSSSSEDDGMGGRRKKGIKDKIREKLPGGHKDDQQQQHQQMGGTGMYGQQGHTGTGTTYGHETGEKKGIMDKIKEKIPGQH